MSMDLTLKRNLISGYANKGMWYSLKYWQMNSATNNNNGERINLTFTASFADSITKAIKIFGYWHKLSCLRGHVLIWVYFVPLRLHSFNADLMNRNESDAELKSFKFALNDGVTIRCGGARERAREEKTATEVRETEDNRKEGKLSTEGEE